MKCEKCGGSGYLIAEGSILRLKGGRCYVCKYCSGTGENPATAQEKARTR